MTVLQKKCISILLGVFYIIVLCGILFIYSASQYLSTMLYHYDWHFALKQGIGIILGSVIIIIGSLIPLKLLQKYSGLLFFAGLVLCLMPHMPLIGKCINGAARWIHLGIGDFQPVEILKPLAFVFLCDFFAKNYYKTSILIWGTIFFILLISFVLLLQPDFGQLCLLIATALILFFIIFYKPSLVVIFLTTITVIGLILIITKPYRLKRLLIFLNPWQDSAGGGFQIIQSIIAFVEGGFFGVGIGHSRQKIHFLPMQHTDFIFSIICEEIGIVGGLCITISLFLFVGIILYISYKSKSLFCQLLSLSYALLFFLQTTFNIFVTLALVPTKGIGLPLIGYGVSSLLCWSLVCGIIISCIIEK